MTGAAPGAWMLAPVAAEIGDGWASVPGRDALVALGWQGLLRVLRAGEPVTVLAPAASPVVRRADLVGVGRDDVDRTTRPEDLAAFLHPGSTLLFTDGERGGTAFRVGDEPGDLAARPWLSIPIERYVDPVGAGDAFLAGVFAAWIRPQLVAAWKGPDPDLRLGAACASLILEGPGVYGVPTLDAAQRRLMTGGA